MIADVVPLLACPVCTADLQLLERSLRCARGHAFDVARQGYVNLMPGGAHAGGDTAQMVAARDRFLSAGHYAPVAAAVAQAVSAAAKDPGGAVLDLGAGTGWYLAHVLLHLEAVTGAAPSGLAVDASPYAARRAARCHPRAGAVVADAWRRLPVRDGAVAVVLDVFAPRSPPEIHRVLRPGGLLVVVTPTQGHLAELRAPLGLLEVEEGKEERLSASLRDRFRLHAQERLDLPLVLSRRDVADVVAMGPNAWHDADGGRGAAVAALPDDVEVRAAVRVATYRRQG